MERSDVSAFFYRIGGAIRIGNTGMDMIPRKNVGWSITGVGTFKGLYYCSSKA